MLLLLELKPDFLPDSPVLRLYGYRKNLDRTARCDLTLLAKSWDCRRGTGPNPGFIRPVFVLPLGCLPDLHLRFLIPFPSCLPFPP